VDIETGQTRKKETVHSGDTPKESARDLKMTEPDAPSRFTLKNLGKYLLGGFSVVGGVGASKLAGDQMTKILPESIKGKAISEKTISSSTVGLSGWVIKSLAKIKGGKGKTLANMYNYGLYGAFGRAIASLGLDVYRLVKGNSEPDKITENTEQYLLV